MCGRLVARKSDFGRLLIRVFSLINLKYSWKFLKKLDCTLRRNLIKVTKVGFVVNR